MTDYDFVIANPEGYDLAPEFVGNAKVTHNQDEALEGADFVYAKNWAPYREDIYGKVVNYDMDWTVSKEKWPSRMTHSSCIACLCAGT